MMNNLKRTLMLMMTAIIVVGLAIAWQAPLVGAQTDTSGQYFPQTGHTVKGRFLEYWQQHGGLMQQGYPLSDELQEVSPTDGRTYTEQYFERAVFELHPENQAPNDVLLSLLGVFEYGARYGSAGAPDQHASTDNGHSFPETGKSIGGKFRQYWETHGGLAQQGYPISEEFQEVSSLDGKKYTVQYFQRAVFELHPENAGTPYEVLLSQLGKFRYRAKYQSSAPTPGPITEDLNSVAMISATEGWAVGASGGTLHFSGGKWQSVGRPSNGPLFDVDMVSAAEGWAVGPNTILHFSNGAWQPVPGAENYAGRLYSVDMISANEGWAVGEGGASSAIMLHYKNGAWQDATPSDVIGSFGVSMLSPNDGWATGIGSGGTNLMLHYSNGIWNKVSVASPGALQSVAMLSPTEGWAVGNSGALLHYTGDTWQQVPSISSIIFLRSVDVVATDEAWAVGVTRRDPTVSGPGVILHYKGGTWSQVSSPSQAPLAGLDMVSPNEGWAVGTSGTILHYLNGDWGVYSPQS